MAMPAASPNPDFASLKEESFNFPLPVKPQVGSCRGTWRRVALLAAIVTTIAAVFAAGMVIGNPLAKKMFGPEPEPQPAGPSVAGSLVLLVGDADAAPFAQDPRVRAPLAAAIASRLPGVGAEMVDIGSPELEAARRLRAQRRLQSLAVRVPYTILTSSADAAADAAAALEELTPETLSFSIMEEMRSAGLDEYSVSARSLEVTGPSLAATDGEAAPGQGPPERDGEAPPRGEQQGGGEPQRGGREEQPEAAERQPIAGQGPAGEETTIPQPGGQLLGPRQQGAEMLQGGGEDGQTPPRGGHGAGAHDGEAPGGEEPEGGPKPEEGEKPEGGPKPEGGEKPEGGGHDGEKPDGEKPERGPRPEEGEKPEGGGHDGEKPDGEKPDGEKPDGEKPERGPKPEEGEKPESGGHNGEKPDGEKPERGPKPEEGEKPEHDGHDGEKPDREKPERGPRPEEGEKPEGGGRDGEKPDGEKPERGPKPEEGEKPEGGDGEKPEGGRR